MSVTYPLGFTAAGVAAGLKASGGLDVALVVNDGASIAAAATFTTNRFAAAPVSWSRDVMTAAKASGRAPRAVVLNSGGANACTGERGAADAAQTAAAAAGALDGVAPDEVLVCSTGLIGVPLPPPLLLAGVATAQKALSSAGGLDAARAIMTTDTHPKTARADVGGYRLGGMAKGAGMLAPGLATMLVVVTTDATLTSEAAQAALEEACAVTFNRIDSDGCMSTNDTVILLASGASGVVPDTCGFTAALTAVCQDLALQLIRDAEGASHDIAIRVTGATTEEAGLAVARAVSRSNLVKAAVFGRDPNWGRVLAAAGTVPAEVAPFDPAMVDVSINGVMVARDGGAHEDRRLVDLSARGVEIVLGLHAGEAEVTLYTNDLTYDYVKENAEYSS